jgi:hypothetical protein
MLLPFINFYITIYITDYVTTGCENQYESSFFEGSDQNECDHDDDISLGNTFYFITCFFYINLSNIKPLCLHMRSALS